MCCDVGQNKIHAFVVVFVVVEGVSLFLEVFVMVFVERRPERSVGEHTDSIAQILEDLGVFLPDSKRLNPVVVQDISRDEKES